MRHTFTPKSQRAILDREYRARALSTLCLALAAAAFIGAAALFPAFIRTSMAEQSASATIALDKAASTTDAESIQSEFSADGSLVALLAGSRGAPRLSDAIRLISSVRSNITLDSFSIGREGSGSIDATIQGVAPTRDGLISFKSRLEGLAPGATVDLPIDELAKSADISFSVRLTAQLP